MSFIEGTALHFGKMIKEKKFILISSRESSRNSLALVHLLLSSPETVDHATQVCALHSVLCPMSA
jgi:hypothetical protein